MDQPPPIDTVVVEAPRLPEAPGEQAFSIYAIDPVRLEAAQRLDDALRSAPGVALFRRNDSAVANPTIQGLSLRASGPSGAGRALVTLDGAPLNDPFGGWVIWGAVPPETIAGATVVRGAGAGPYGAGALLGAVRLEERAINGARLSLQTGDRGSWRISGLGQASGDELSLMLAANLHHDDGWIPVRAGRGAADQPLWLDSAAGVARLNWRSQRLAFSARLSGYDEERGGGVAGVASASSGASLSLALAQPHGDMAWRVQAWAARSDLSNTFAAVAADRNTTTPANNQYATPTLGWGMNAALRFNTTQSGLELGADVRAADGETRELFRFIGGAFTRGRIAGGQTVVAGVYAEAWRQFADTLVSGGVRLDQWRATGGQRTERDILTNAPTLSLRPSDHDALAPTARLGARRYLDTTHYLRGALYAGFRPPTLNELHRPFRVGNDITEANSALDLERLRGVDLAFGGDSEALHWNIGVFATRLDDAIVNVTLGAGPATFPPGVFVPAGGVFRQRMNAGRIDALGLEAEARGAFAAASWRAGVNYTDASMVGGELDGLRPAQSPKWSVVAALSLPVGARSALGLDLAYESRRFEDDVNSRSLAAATTLSLHFDHALTENVRFTLALDNALDAEVETAETADGIESLGPPRALRLALTIAN